MMLVAAKWREFSAAMPDGGNEETPPEEEGSYEKIPKRKFAARKFTESSKLSQTFEGCLSNQLTPT